MIRLVLNHKICELKIRTHSCLKILIGKLICLKLIKTGFLSTGKLNGRDPVKLNVALT